MNLNEESFDGLVNKLSTFNWTKEWSVELAILRADFRTSYDEKKINELQIEDYFLAHGRQRGSMAWELEWGTRKLGSIKGGSSVKFGYEEDFASIKALLQNLVKFNDGEQFDADEQWLRELIELSLRIRGFRTGRTVIPKLLSIYYLDKFIPVFNDQDIYIQMLTFDGPETENKGLALYIENNRKLLSLKKEVEARSDRKLANDEFANLLYFAFPKDEAAEPNVPEIIDTINEQKFEALEVQHYQTLLHRNFNVLFPGLRYFDEAAQKPKNGQYDTQVVGIMDFLTVDADGNFVVVEIKRQATDKTIGQILRYMGWVKEELCREGQLVSGLIVAEQMDTQLEFALKVTDSVRFRKLVLSITVN